MITKKIISVLLGKQSSYDNDLQMHIRHHQSWWRTCVLAEEQGLGTQYYSKLIGSSVLDGENEKINFMDVYAQKAVKGYYNARGVEQKGFINKDQLFNNLLSSQALSINFFGRLKYNLPLATQVFKQFYPEIKVVTDIHFDYAPNAATNGDNSSHDLAFEFISISDQNGIVGLECKYTEPFSPCDVDEKYRKLYEDSSSFQASYEELIDTSYCQLFRNQLIVESALISHSIKIGYSGLFCLGDKDSLTTGKAFQKMLKNGEERFKIITFANLIETIQKLEIDWNIREWSMMLWARYCGLELSKRFKQ